MASFKNAIQIIFALFIGLWTVVARFFIAFVSVFRLRSAGPVLPTHVLRCQTTYTRFIDLTGTLDQAMPHPRPKAAIYPPSAEVVCARPTAVNIPPTTKSVICNHQQAPFVPVREALAKDPIFVRPLPSLGSASAISVRSNSTGPKTPSPPPSPVIAVQVVAQEDNDCNTDSTGILNDDRYVLDIKKDSPLQVITAEMTASSESIAISKYNNLSSTDSDISIDMPMIQSHEQILFSPPYTADSDTSDVDHIHDVLPNTFGSRSSSMSSVFESISELQGLDWPFPPGPVFKFQDELSAAADIAEAVLQRRLESPIPPLRIVKRNTTPPPRNVFDDVSFPISDASEYTEPSTLELEVETGNCSTDSTDSHPFLDISAPHLFSEEIITAAHARSERSHKLNNILSTLPKDELVGISNLPTGTVVCLSDSDSEKTDSYKLKYPDTKSNVSDAAHHSRTIPVPAKSTRYSPASTPSTSRSSTAPCTPLISTKHLAPFFQRKEEKFPSPFDDFALLLLEAEYDRWMAGFADPDPRLGFMNEQVCEENKQ